MKWLIDNWSLLVVIFAAICVVVMFVKRFVELPSEEQTDKVREWLLYAVIMAEKELGSGTGQLKLRYVYDMFIDKFPSLVTVVPFEIFSMWVDEALERMKPLLKTNKNLAGYVGTLDGNESSNL